MKVPKSVSVFCPLLNGEMILPDSRWDKELYQSCAHDRNKVARTFSLHRAQIVPHCPR